MYKIEKFVLISVFVFIIAISGCTSLNPVENNTFSKGGITFQYPGTWKENITFNYTSAPTENNTILGTMGDNTVAVSVSSTNLTNNILSSFSIESLAQISEEDFAAGELISTNKSTFNNITFFEQIYKSESGVSGEKYKNYRILFGKQGKIVYIIIFKTKVADFEKSYKQMKDIQSSIKYS
jgi:hypothetical protein